MRGGHGPRNMRYDPDATFVQKNPLKIRRTLDPDCDSDHHQNLITWSLVHALPLPKFSQKSVENFWSNLADRQTGRPGNKTSFFNRGNTVNVSNMNIMNLPTGHFS